MSFEEFMESKKLQSAPQHIQVIINPAAGQAEPVLRILHEEFEAHGIEWNAEIATDIAEVPNYVDRAVESGADLLAVYGGDGTVSAVAAALEGSDLPMAILPGGTGNVLAAELFIPEDLRQACQIMMQKPSVRQVDMASVGDRRFILRVGIGLEAEMVNQADPELKSRLGSLAYGLAGLAALQNPQTSEFTIEMDGRTVQEQAVTCLVANSGSLGQPGLNLSPRMRIDDGLLDVILLRQVDLDSVAEVLASVIGTPAEGRSLMHWQAKQIRVEADPPRQAEADGEHIGDTPLEFRVLAGKLKLVVGRRQG